MANSNVDTYFIMTLEREVVIDGLIWLGFEGRGEWASTSHNERKVPLEHGIAMNEAAADVVAPDE
jgi:hypothetical protein